jgi:hypothetical protein
MTRTTKYRQNALLPVHCNNRYPKTLHESGYQLHSVSWIHWILHVGEKADNRILAFRLNLSLSELACKMSDELTNVSK